MSTGTAPVKQDGRAYQRATRVLPDLTVFRWAAWAPDGNEENSRGQGQADISAEQPASRARAWLPAADADPGRTRDRLQSAYQGSSQAHGVKSAVSSSGI